MKMKIITPVHVGTGEVIWNFAYDYDKESQTIFKYDVHDVLSTIPSDKLLNPIIHENLIEKQRSSAEFLNYLGIKEIDYRDLTRKYELKTSIELERFHKNKYGVCEQIKHQFRPYIPGSTIKGMVISSIVYKIMKDHISKVKDKDMNGISKNDNILKYIEGIEKESDFIKSISSIITCKDVVFTERDMSLYYGRRVGTKSAGEKNANGEIPLGYFETLKVNSESEKGNYIDVLSYQLDYIASDSNPKNRLNRFGLNLIKKYCSDRKVILQNLKEYFDDLIEYESKKEYPYLNNDIKEKIRQNNIKVKEQMQKGIVIRLGRNNGYNFKSLAVLLKSHTKTSPFYASKFDTVFSPSKKSNYKNVPTTLVVLEDAEDLYTGGYILISDYE